MVVRWTVTALMEAEERFRRVRGYKHLHQLETGLATLIHIEQIDEALIA